MAARFLSLRWHPRPGPAARLLGPVGITVLLMALAACQPLPRPFQPTDKTVTPAQLVQLGPRAGIVVTVPDGIAPEHGQQFASLLAAALRDRDLPASSIANPRLRYALSGRIDSREVTARRTELLLRWRLVDPEGGVFATWDRIDVVDTVAWQSGASAVLAYLAGRAAERLSGFVATGGSDPVLTHPRVVAVWPVAGAPGNGETELARAVEAALRLRGVRIAETVEVDAFVVAGSVSVSPGPGRQRIDIHWVLIRPDGIEVGSVNQSNTLPAGSLDGPWGEVAVAIADGAAEGLAALLLLPDLEPVEPDL